MLKHFYLMGSSEMTLGASHVIKQGNKEGVKKINFLELHSQNTKEYKNVLNNDQELKGSLHLGKC
jgi:hypothetical protein